MHKKILVCSLSTMREYVLVERYPRLSWEGSLYCVVRMSSPPEQLTQWVALDEPEIAGFVEYHISEE